MGKHVKKPTKHSINWAELIIGALVDLVVGIILILLSRIFK